MVERVRDSEGGAGLDVFVFSWLYGEIEELYSWFGCKIVDSKKGHKQKKENGEMQENEFRDREFVESSDKFR